MSVPADTFELPAPLVEAPADTKSQTPPADKPAADGDQAKTQEQQQTEAGDGDQSDRDDKGRFKGVQPRIDELTRKRHEAEREAAYWKGVATQGKVQTSAVPQQAAPAAPTKPTPDQYEDYGAYVEALAEFKADEKVNQALSKREADAAQRQQAQQQTSAWEHRQAAARTAMPDYDQVVGASDAPVAAAVAEAIRDSEHGPALAYHLAKHPDVLDRLNGLSPRQVDREVGRLEERLSTSASSAAAADAPAVRITQAPKPAAAIQGQGRSVALDPSRMSMDEYAAFRAKGPNKARWAR